MERFHQGHAGDTKNEPEGGGETKQERKTGHKGCGRPDALAGGRRGGAAAAERVAAGCSLRRETRCAAQTSGRAGGEKRKRRGGTAARRGEKTKARGALPQGIDGGHRTEGRAIADCLDGKKGTGASESGATGRGRGEGRERRGGEATRRRCAREGGIT